MSPHRFPFIVLVLVSCVLAGCGRQPVPRATAEEGIDSVANAVDTPFVCFVSDEEPQPMFVWRDTVVGQFVRGVTDTLIMESGEMERGQWDWSPYTMRSLRGSVSPIDFGIYYGVYFENAGDLDEDGTDELWICPHNMSPQFGYAYLFIAYRDSAWRALTPEIRISLDELLSDDPPPPDFRHIYRKSGRPGYVHVKTTRTLYLDSLGNLLREPVNSDIDALERFHESHSYLDFEGYETVEILLPLKSAGKAEVYPYYHSTQASYY